MTAREALPNGNGGHAGLPPPGLKAWPIFGVGEAAVVSWRLPREHTDIEIHEIESSRRITATSFPVACECKMVTTPGWCIPRSTIAEITP